MQGGLNSDIPFEFYTEIVTRTVNEFPDITPHFFSAPEIMKMSEVSGLTVKEGFFRWKLHFDFKKGKIWMGPQINGD